MDSATYQRLESPNVIQVGESVAPLPRSTEIQIGNAIMFILFILVNILAAAGVFPHTPRDIRHAHPTYLDAADFTFLIWPVIYLLAALFALYQAPPHRCTSITIFQEIHGLFILSCLFQISWLISLCYAAPPIIPFLLVACLLASLVAAYLRINRISRMGFAIPIPRYICIHLLFSVFLAWVTMETAWMLSWMLRQQFEWYGKPWHESAWAVVVLALLAVVTMVTLFTQRDGVFGLVVAWSCFGVAKAHHHVDELKVAGYVFGGILMITSLLALAIKYRRWEEERSGLKVRIIQASSP